MFLKLKKREITICQVRPLSFRKQKFFFRRGHFIIRFREIYLLFRTFSELNLQYLQLPAKHRYIRYPPMH